LERQGSYLGGKTIFFVVLIIVIPVLVLIAALFIKQEFKVEKEIVINKPRQEIFNYIKFLRNQSIYGKRPAYDSSTTEQYDGIDGTLGFVLQWKNKKEYAPVMEERIKKIIEGDQIEYELIFRQPFSTDFVAYIGIASLTDSTTKVKWGAKRKVGYPFNIQRLSLNMEDSVGNYFEIGLINLKHILEKH